MYLYNIKCRCKASYYCFADLRSRSCRETGRETTVRYEFGVCANDESVQTSVKELCSFCAKIYSADQIFAERADYRL